MGETVRLIGGAERAIPALIPQLREASFQIQAGQIEAGQSLAQPVLLVTLAEASDPAIAAAEAFAMVDGGHRLVVNIWHLQAAPGWEAARHAASMAAFTRHAALAWAGRHVRVNGLTLTAVHAADRGFGDDAAAAILALWRWPSMTGQIIHLGA